MFDLWRKCEQKNASDFQNFPAASPNLFLILPIHRDDISSPSVQQVRSLTLAMACELKCQCHTQIWVIKSTQICFLHVNAFLLDVGGKIQKSDAEGHRTQNAESVSEFMLRSELLTNQKHLLFTLQKLEINIDVGTTIHLDVSSLYLLDLPYITHLILSIHLTFLI